MAPVVASVLILAPPKSIVLPDRYRLRKRCVVVPRSYVILLVGIILPVVYIFPFVVPTMLPYCVEIIFPAYTFPLMPTPPLTVTAPVELLVLVAVFVNDVAPVTAPPLKLPPPPDPLLYGDPLAQNTPFVVIRLPTVMGA